MVENLLRSCGLNPSEQAVVICLLERGTSIASLISKATGLKRPTVYAALENLLDYGLVLKQKKGAVTYFSLVDLGVIPSVLEHRAQQKFDQVQHATRALRSQLELYKPQQPMEIAGFDVQPIDSVEAIYAQLEASLMGGDFSSIFNPQLAVVGRSFERLVLGFLRRTSVSKPNIREICVAGPKTDWYCENIGNPNHLVKQIAADEKVLSDMIFVNGSVFIAHYQASREAAIKVTHPDYYQSMMAVFELLWQRL